MDTALLKLHGVVTKKTYSALFITFMNEHKMYIDNRKGHQAIQLSKYVHLQDYLEERATYIMGIKPISVRKRHINLLLGTK